MAPGVVSLTWAGSFGERIMAPKQEGGFNGYPVMLNLGYQAEVQYLSEGKFQALFEILPMISGLDQGIFSPSLTILNGFRSNVSGWEFAFGPTVSLTTFAEGYYDETSRWVMVNSDNEQYAEMKDAGLLHDELDRRGKVRFRSALLVGFGKSFRSGRLNIPVNLHVIPSRNDGFRVGLTFGFNTIE